MFCENCGKEMQNGDKFCTKCGNPALVPDKPCGTKLSAKLSEERWWYRLLKVFYVFVYIPLPFLLWLVWADSSTSYDYYSQITTQTQGEAFWYSLLTLLIYLSIVRLVKIAVLYVAIAQKPRWGIELKRLY